MSETSTAPRKALTAMRLGELQELASGMGLTLDSKARRNDYITAIREARSSSGADSDSAPADQPQRPERAEAKESAEDSSDESEGSSDRRRPRGRRENNRAPKLELDLPTPAKAEEPEEDHELPEDKLAALEALGEAASRKAQESHRRERGRRGEGESRREDDSDSRGDSRSRDDSRGDSRRSEGQSRRDDSEAADSRRQDTSRDGEDEGDNRRRRNDRRRERPARRDGRQRDNRGDSRGDNRNDRQRQNDSDSDYNDQVKDGDVLLKVAGILDIDGNNAYLRTAGYLPGSNDAYVSQALIKRNKLRRGDAIVGAVRDLGESSGGGGGGRGGSRQRHKYNPLVEIDSVNGLTLEQLAQRPEFGKLTPLYPNEMLRMETSPKAITPRVIDLVAPIGKGQRGLIVSPPKAGKTMIMQQMANAIAVNNPDVHLMVVLVDERPEEVTDMQRMVKGEVIASTFDRPASEHTVVAELAIERAKRLVELGQDVVVLLDSITRLSRAYNLAAPASGRILSGGVDAGALYPPKRFFGAARNVENGGSLTILASALVETGSKMDEVIFEEFKGTGNMELRLSRQLADRRIFPAVDINASGTRREELLFSPEELKIVWQLRRALGTLEVQEASDFLLGRLRKSESNGEFLMTIAKNMQQAGE
ncbi:transcription termination factor Rho [Flaviflexus salsibiostraticola]|uniref:Transcription termination factor Rho n=1 Tax=Flaviflexus salsibiostraticola TaxID=1282737 RepID=A0A3Q8WTF4_9ACTO|nr:transcription termination factor Rho [Flaviflexus salsibiostraticola]AZN29913.1 transcription termination factor Rho [Flaviflexus salsibiostraticola]